MIAPPENPAWFCLRSHPKREHIAAACLQKDLALETFLPRISFKRSTPRGPVWFTEALFPNYLFARFGLAASILAVRHARGVRGVIHFGDRWPAVPEAVVAELRAALGHRELHIVPEALDPGQAVEIAGGVFHGLAAVVLRVMPGQERIAVLLEFLGRQSTVELGLDSVVKPAAQCRNPWSKSG